MNLQQLQEAQIDEALNGQTSIAAGDLAVVNPSESLPVGIGPPADQPFFSGSSQNVRTTWVEQGWGHDSQRWPSYPFSDNANPARRKSRLSSLSAAQRENPGTLSSWVQATGTDAARQGWWRQWRRSGAQAHGAIINSPDGIPYTDTVPTYSGGAVAHPGVDVPLSMLYGA